jgi:hypothetical protein
MVKNRDQVQTSTQTQALSGHDRSAGRCSTTFGNVSMCSWVIQELRN